MLTRSRAVLGLTALSLAGALALTGCASNSDNSAGGSSPSSSSAASTPATSSSSSSSSLASLVPANIKAAGKLVVGVNVPYAPNEYLDSSGNVVGWDVDLLNAVAQELGLTTEYKQADFDKIIPAVQAGTYDIGMSSFTDTKQREQTVDFVDYATAGELWASQAGKTVDPANACGLTVAVQSNTTEAGELPGLSKKCTSAGKKAITILSYDSQDQATNAVVVGKADAMTADSPITGYAIAKSGGKLQAAGQVTEAAPYGYPIKKGSTLVQAIQKAVQALIGNGTYDQICKRWGLASAEIQTATVNGATS